MKLRPYQRDLVAGIEGVLANGGCALGVLPTGGGKTPASTRVLKNQGGACVAIAHRKELVGQMSRALAREGMYHRIVAPEPTIKDIVGSHVEEFGRSYFRCNADPAVAGIDSVKNAPKPWRHAVKVWWLDEGHHLLRDNKWGKGLAMFPAARGFGVTATPERPDGKGLGKHADGLYTHLVEGPTMRDLINDGHLTDYRIVAPPTDLDLSGVRVGSTGDFVRRALSAAVHKSRIVGDVVAHYKRFAEGLLGVTFAVDIAAAEEIAAAYNAAGVPALAVSSKTPAGQRADALRKFARREVLQLVNVDLFGEGFDAPAMGVVSMVRPTRSWVVYCQQFGRVLRLMAGKTHGLIIDHVGNVAALGLPDRMRNHTLDRRERRSSAKRVIQTVTCAECFFVYERVHYECPFCGASPVPADRTKPEHVSGDLVELDVETLARMRGEVAKMNRTAVEVAAHFKSNYLPDIAVNANVARHRRNQAAQKKMRDAAAWWAGWKAGEGLDERQLHRAFWLAFNVDTLTAQALTERDALSLFERIVATLPVHVRGSMV